MESGGGLRVSERATARQPSRKVQLGNCRAWISCRTIAGADSRENATTRRCPVVVAARRITC